MVRHYRRKRQYATAQRILVHLSGEAGDPEDRTQEGIAAATMSGRPTVTKWLKTLESRGALVRERARIQAYELPRFVYRLSDDGWRLAEQIRRRLAADVVEIHSPSLGVLSLRVPDVPALVSPPLELATAISLIHRGRLNLASVPPWAWRSRRSLVWGSSLRRADHLFGRSQELHILDGWYESRGSILLVTGLAGIGKSALIAGWIQRRRRRAHVFVFQLDRTTKASTLLGDFGAFLATLGRRNLSAHLSQGGRLGSPLIERILSRDLEDTPVLVVIDNLEKSSRDVSRFVRGPLTNILQSATVKLILLSRRLPTWIASSGKVTPVEVMRLRGLDPAASRELLRHRGLGVNGDLVRSIVASTRGHPLLLHLAAQGASGNVSTIQEYFEKELWGSLSSEERDALEAASVFRHAVPTRVLVDAAGVHRRVILDLRSKNLLEQTVSGDCLVHDLVREFLHSRMTGPRIRELHERAARPLLRRHELRDRWEGVYHLIMANRVAESALYLDSEGAPLLDSVAAEEVASLTRDMRPEEMDPTVACVFSEVVGDSLSILGHIGPALFQYEHARTLAEKAGKLERMPRLLRKMGFLERCRNRYGRALGYLIEARARLKGVHDSTELAEVLRETALVEQATGNLSAAAGYLDEAIDLATETGDHAALSRALMALGSLETQRGHREEGLNYNLEGLRIAERLGNLTEIARAHIVVGTGLTELGRLDEGLRHFQQGTEVARLLGNLRLTAYGTMDQAATLIDLKRYEEAAGPLHEAESYFEILEERDTLALLRISAGQIEMRLGRVPRAERIWQESVDELRKLGTPVELARALASVAKYQLEHHLWDGARTNLEEAKKVASHLGNATLLLEITEALRRVEDRAIQRKAV